MCCYKVWQDLWHEVKIFPCKDECIWRLSLSLHHLCKWTEAFNMYFSFFAFSQLNLEVKMQFFLYGYLLVIRHINSFWIVWRKCQWGKAWALMEVLMCVIYLKVNWNRISWNTNCLRVQKQGPPYGCFCCLLLSVKSLVRGTSINQDQLCLASASTHHLI